MKLSHSSHSPWKSTQYVDSHITHRTTTTDISTLHKSGHLNFAPTCSISARVEMSLLCQVEMSYKDGLGNDECSGAASGLKY